MTNNVNMINAFGPELLVYAAYTSASEENKPTLALYQGKLYIYDPKPSGAFSKLLNAISKTAISVLYTLDFNQQHINDRLFVISTKVSELEKVSERNRALFKEQKELSGKIEENNKTISSQENQKNTLLDEISKLKQELQLLKREIASTVGTAKKCKEELPELKAKREALRKQLGEMTIALNHKQRAIEEAEQTLHTTLEELANGHKRSAERIKKGLAAQQLINLYENMIKENPLLQELIHLTETQGAASSSSSYIPSSEENLQ